MEKTVRLHPYYVFIAIVLTAGVVTLSLMPGSSVPKVKIPHLDKLVHFVMYFSLTISYFYAFFNNGSGESRQLLWPSALAAVVGLMVETLQHFMVSSRYFDKFDILANVIGCFFAILLIKKLSLSAQIKL
jgi:VanZ family protein